jgi:hypothetical protein
MDVKRILAALHVELHRVNNAIGRERGNRPAGVQYSRKMTSYGYQTGKVTRVTARNPEGEFDRWLDERCVRSHSWRSFHAVRGANATVPHAWL